MRARILYHDHCFDGAASAAFFSRFLEGKFHPDAEFEFTGLAHKASQLFEPSLFDGDVNAIVDFKYSTDPRLTWWFDHHQSAFLTPEDAEHFRRDTSGQKMYDPTFRSCTKYIATIARERFGFDAPDLAELVSWADIIDGAQYANAQGSGGAARAGHAAHAGDRGQQGLGDRAEDHPHDAAPVAGRDRRRSRNPGGLPASVRAPSAVHRHHPQAGPLRGRRGVLRSGGPGPGRLQQVHSVLSVPAFGVHGFGEHVQFPDQGFGGIESLGRSIRWTTTWRRICERYGGGGHPRVGAISFEIGAIEQARKAAAKRSPRELKS